MKIHKNSRYSKGHESEAQLVTLCGRYDNLTAIVNVHTSIFLKLMQVACYMARVN